MTASYRPLAFNLGGGLGISWDTDAIFRETLQKLVNNNRWPFSN
jgi:hypothetical protein